MDPEYSRRINYVINNSTFRILSHTGGISGIQVVATLNATATETTWSHYSAGFYRTPMRAFLFKFVRYRTHGDIGYVVIPGIRPRAFEIQTPDEIRDEALAQYDVYLQSLQQNGTALEPICPMVLAYANGAHPTANVDNQRVLRLMILANLVPRGGRTLADEQNIINLFLGAQYGFILQEFITPSDTLYNFEHIHAPAAAPRATYDDLFGPLALYELIRLNMLGYDHNDFHGNNALINPTYNYLGNYSLGRAYIIDFGRLRPTGRQIRTIHEGIDYLRHSHTLANNPRLQAVLNRQNIQQLLTDIDARRREGSIAFTRYLSVNGLDRLLPNARRRAALHVPMGGGNKDDIEGEKLSKKEIKEIEEIIASITAPPQKIDLSELKLVLPNGNKSKSKTPKRISSTSASQRINKRQTRSRSRSRTPQPASKLSSIHREPRKNITLFNQAFL